MSVSRSIVRETRLSSQGDSTSRSVRLWLRPLCCVFGNLSVPWCEIHTRRGKLCAREKSDDDLAWSEKRKEHPMSIQKKHMKKEHASKSLPKMKWRSWRSPFADTLSRKRKKAILPALINEIEESTSAADVVRFEEQQRFIDALPALVAPRIECRFPRKKEPCLLTKSTKKRVRLRLL